MAVDEAWLRRDSRDESVGYKPALDKQRVVPLILSVGPFNDRKISCSSIISILTEYHFMIEFMMELFDLILCDAEIRLRLDVRENRRGAAEVARHFRSCMEKRRRCKLS
jgi:hypothetical protein